MRDVVIVDSVRTGLAKSFRGTFNMTRPDDMLAHCIDSLLARNGKLDPAEVEDVIVGAASQTGEQGGNIARLAVILSQLPVTTSGVTISRACSSGLNSIAFAANQIASGCSEVMIAGGVESISAVHVRPLENPIRTRPSRKFHRISSWPWVTPLKWLLDVITSLVKLRINSPLNLRCVPQRLRKPVCLTMKSCR